MMYNPQLDTFICVVEAGSFSKAAEELYISAPAVIKQINSLENSLNLQLFERTHRGLIITEAGKSLYPDNWMVPTHIWKNVAPDTCDTLCIMPPNMSATGIQHLQPILLKNERKVNITMLPYHTL